MLDTYMGVLQNKYADFSGRASRKEYWTFALINLAIAFILGFMVVIMRSVAHVDLSFISMLFSLAVMVPGIAVAVRRLHDTNRSGWLVLVGLIPFIGAIAMIVLLVMEGTPGDNEYGPSPYKEVALR